MFQDISDLSETVPLIQYKLQNFKKVNRNLYNFSCPICGDSKKNKSKTRGYIYPNPHAKTLWYKCFNCLYHKPYIYFLKDVDNALYEEVMLKTFVSKNTSKKEMDFSVDLDKLEFNEDFIEPSILASIMEPILCLPPNHKARVYIESRKLPTIKLNDIYFVENIKDIEQLSDKYKDKMTDGESRIGLPYRNREGQVIGISLRSLQVEHPIKYLHLKFHERYPLIYNIENVDLSKRVYALEGQFDSMFFQNGIAASGSAFSRVCEVVPVGQCTYIHDNEPRHKDTLKAIDKSIKSGYSVALLPHSIKSKDINGMILSGEVKQEELKGIVDKHTYRGLEANLRFAEWKMN